MSDQKTNKATWRERNREYLRQYQRQWRADYKEKHGISYETQLARRKRDGGLGSSQGTGNCEQ